MKSLMLWKCIADESAMWCCTDARLDFRTVEARTKTEGFSFLTITLPSFARDFERCLDQGFVDDAAFPGFRRHRGLPRFLSGFLRLIFDGESGVLLDGPNVLSISCVRQLTLMFKRIEDECTPQRVAAAFEGFIKCEQDVERFETMAVLNRQSFANYERLGTLLFGDVLSSVDREIYSGEVIPKHGPGATADSLYGNQKWLQTLWTERLEEYFPFLEHVLPNYRYYSVLDETDFLEPGAEIPVKVITVPKTMKSPRLIGIEPTCMQYVQQGISLSLRRYLSSFRWADMVGIEDQIPNQEMARRGSLMGDLATLDLKEASDRISWFHVRSLLRNHPHLLGAVDACRSRHATLPDGSVHRLNKFATMGSALTFPIETMVFLTVVLEGIESGLGHRLTKKDLSALLGQVRVFGDDIIVPTDYVRSVTDNLHRHGFVVNRHKSFSAGNFRESCGGDFYEGMPVKPAYLNRKIPQSRKDVQEILSFVAFRNNLFQRGYDSALVEIDKAILRILGRFPYVSEGSPVLGRHTHDPSLITCDLVHADYQQPLQRGWVVSNRIPLNEISDWAALRKCLTSLEKRSVPSADSDLEHLRRSGRPRFVSIKIGVGTI
jgi:hypothetical protein